MLLKNLVSALSILVSTAVVYADNALVHQKEVQQFVNELVSHDHFTRNDIVKSLKVAQYQPQIIESMEKPYEKKSWDVYKALFITPKRVQSGIEFWQANAATLARAQKEYGVPAEIIVAILGVETQYGKRQGEYRVLDALTTLAFYYPKRADYFKKELREYFLLCREHHVSPTQYIGSYAGAIGQPQFMPSSYRTFAVDYAGHGYRDLVNDNKDVIGSIANYFHQHGWVPNQYVAQPARLEHAQLSQLAVNSKNANLTYRQLLTAGVKPFSLLRNPPNQVGLIELITDKGNEYWMAYPNFYVITRYNTSPQYALAVYLLSLQLRNQRALALTKQANALVHAYG
jgi:membrane-bound lytic murein transglycosylase B